MYTCKNHNFNNYNYTNTFIQNHTFESDNRIPPVHSLYRFVLSTPEKYYYANTVTRASMPMAKSHWQTILRPRAHADYTERAICDNRLITRS